MTAVGVGTMAIINPWVAIGATTSPSLRAPELRQIWDDYLGAMPRAPVRRPSADPPLLSGLDGTGLFCSPALL